MPHDKNVEDGIIRGYIKGRIRERGVAYSLRLMRDPDFFESEFRDVKEFLTYEKGIEFEDE